MKPVIFFSPQQRDPSLNKSLVLTEILSGLNSLVLDNPSSSLRQAMPAPIIPFPDRCCLFCKHEIRGQAAFLSHQRSKHCQQSRKRSIEMTEPAAANHSQPFKAPFSQAGMSTTPPAVGKRKRRPYGIVRRAYLRKISNRLYYLQTS